VDTESMAKGVSLSSEDRARMARLFEEVESRLHEMARIAARTLNRDTSPGYEIKFNPHPSKQTDEPGPVDIEIICDEHGCICYDYREGICIPC
jgi:hypothetical protein